jgi:hypothetical protein
MTFLNPILAGVGLACVSLPIIIHILMRRRRKPILWGAMRFLLEAYRQHRKRIRLEQFLLLASRCLLVALIAVALGRPLLGSGASLAGRGAVTLYLLIDNSLAASATDEAGKAALERHKTAAAALLRQMDAAAGDRVAVIALGGPARGVVDPPSPDAGAVGEVVKGITTTDSAADIPGALALVASSVASKDSGHGNVVVAVLSDFLTGSADAQKKLEALGTKERPVTVLATKPLAEGMTNISIEGAEPERPVVVSRAAETSGASQVKVTLKRSGPGVRDAAATTVRLAVQPDSPSGKAMPVNAGQFVVRWKPGETEATGSGAADLSAVMKQFAGGSGAAVLTASIDADAVAGDNIWRRPIEVRRTLRVGLVSPRRLGSAKPGVQQFEPADWVRLALEPTEGGRADGDAEVIEIEPTTLDATRLAGLDAAIIVRPDSLPEGAWRRLRAFTDQGGFVLVFPAPGAGVQLWTDAMVRDMGLPWTVSREVKSWPQGVGISGIGAGGLLSVLAPELPDLTRPVRVLKALSVEGAGVPMLKTTEEWPLLVGGVPGLKGEGEQSHGLVAMLLVAMTFEWTDLQTKPLMVPLMWELVKQGVGSAHGSWSALAGYSLKVPARSAELRSEGGTAAAASVKVQNDVSQEAIRNAGVWRAVDETGALRGLVAVNADPAGGRTDAQPEGAIGTWLAGAAGRGESVRWLDGNDGLGGGGTAAALARTGDSMKLVLPLLLVALVVGVMELAMARWFSHASAGATVLPAAAEGGAA